MAISKSYNISVARYHTVFFCGDSLIEIARCTLTVKKPLTASFSLTCLKIRSRNEEAINSTRNETGLLAKIS